jgi:hypothetical protein
LTNHFKDQEENFENTKVLCRFLNPAVASAIWDRKDTEVTVSTPDVFFENISKDLKGKYSTEELAEMMKDPKHYSEDLTRIEKA